MLCAVPVGPELCDQQGGLDAGLGLRHPGRKAGGPPSPCSCDRETPRTGSRNLSSEEGRQVGSLRRRQRRTLSTLNCPLRAHRTPDAQRAPWGIDWHAVSPVWASETSQESRHNQGLGFVFFLEKCEVWRRTSAQWGVEDFRSGSCTRVGSTRTPVPARHRPWRPRAEGPSGGGPLCREPGSSRLGRSRGPASWPRGPAPIPCSGSASPLRPGAPASDPGSSRDLRSCLGDLYCRQKRFFP